MPQKRISAYDISGGGYRRLHQQSPSLMMAEHTEHSVGIGCVECNESCVSVAVVWLASCGKVVVVGGRLLLGGGNGPLRSCARSLRWYQIGGLLMALVIRSAICCLVLQ